MPLVVFFVIIFKTVQKTKLYEPLLEPKTSNGFKDIMLFILFLPWNLSWIAFFLAVGSIFGAILMPILVWPAWFYNLRRYYRTMSYWGGKHRFKSEAKIEKIKNPKIVKRDASRDILHPYFNNRDS